MTNSESNEIPGKVGKRRILLRGVFGVAIAFSLVSGANALVQLRHAWLMRAQYAPAPEGMFFVPPGEFQKGSDDAEADAIERPAKRVFLPGFYIDRTEVTNTEFQRFDPTHTFAPEKRDFPVVKCSKVEADHYAAWAGKRLPTGNEWEKAARGCDGRIYPWGDTFDPAKANLGGKRSLEPVGSYPQGASPYGALDMAGNAWEWISDVYNDGGTRRGIIRGGAYAYSALQGRSSHIGFESDDLTCGDLGFRCVKDATPQ